MHVVCVGAAEQLFTNLFCLFPFFARFLLRVTTVAHLSVDGNDVTEAGCDVSTLDFADWCSAVGGNYASAGFSR